MTRLRFLRLVRSSRKLRYIGAWREESHRPGEAEDRKNTRGGQGARGSGIAPYENSAICRAQTRHQDSRYCPRLIRGGGAVLRWRAAEHNRPRRAALGRPSETQPPNSRDVPTDKLARGRGSAVGRLFAAAANATFSPSTRFWRAPAPAGDGPRSSARCGARIP